MLYKSIIKYVSGMMSTRYLFIWEFHVVLGCSTWLEPLVRGSDNVSKWVVSTFGNNPSLIKIFTFLCRLPDMVNAPLYLVSVKHTNFSHYYKISKHSKYRELSILVIVIKTSTHPIFYKKRVLNFCPIA